jgi:enoyl-CoA hydratase
MKTVLRLICTSSRPGEEAMAYTMITCEKKDNIAILTLARPAAGNTINREMVQELEEACGWINGEDKIYVVLITGAGNDFCMGVEVDAGSYFKGPASLIAGIDRPVIAAINGNALGQGLEVALGCDIRLAAAGARFGLPQVSHGVIPVDGGTQRLPRTIGRGKALELLMTAETITAAEALDIGLVSRVVSEKSLLEEAIELAETIAAKGPLALRYLKEAVIKGMDVTLEQGLRLEADLYFLLHTTRDRTEGIQAFRDKREPDFEGK